MVKTHPALRHHHDRGTVCQAREPPPSLTPPVAHPQRRRAAALGQADALHCAPRRGTQWGRRRCERGGTGPSCRRRASARAGGTSPPEPSWDSSLWGHRHRERQESTLSRCLERSVPWPEGGKSWGRGGEAPEGARDGEKWLIRLKLSSGPNPQALSPYRARVSAWRRRAARARMPRDEVGILTGLGSGPEKAESALHVTVATDVMVW